MALLERAVAADPDFADAYRSLAERQARQNPAQAIATLDRALARGSRLPERERLRIEFTLATLRNDGAARERAVSRLVQIDPYDPAHWSSLAEIAMIRREYPAAVGALHKFLELDPQRPGGWNQLGYAAGFAGDLPAAETALRRYEALAPGDPNALDSLGDVNLLNGRLREAESYYLQALKKQPGFLNHADLYKAAMARLMSGDTSGADGLATQYADARAAAHDPAVELFRAEWFWTSGRRTEGLRRLQEFARTSEAGGRTELAARAYAESAIWSSLMGDRTGATAAAGHAVPLSSTPASRGLTTLARFLSQPQLPQAAPPPGMPDLLLAYTLLLAGDYKAATAPVERIWQRTAATSEDHSDVLLAWVRVETDRTPDALPLLRPNVIPSASGPGPLLSFVFPRIYYLRGLAAEKTGHGEDARVNYRLFLQLSGDRQLVWGEEKAATLKLGH
jgi:tetratricopeptide (TPR) repeat protein